MKNLFSPDSSLMRFLTRLWDLVLLNVLWILFCLPVVSIGASTCAMNSVVQKLVRDECDSVFRDFITAIRIDWKKATLIYAITIVLMMVAYLGIYAVLGGITAPVVVDWLLMICVVLIIFIVMYMYPLFARFENTVLGTVKNAFILSITYFPKSICIALINLFPIIILFFSFRGFLFTLMFWIVIGGAAMAYITALLLRSIFSELEKV